MRRAAPRCRSARVRGVVRDLLQCVPGQLLAALVDLQVGGAARRADRIRARRRLPDQGHRRADLRGGPPVRRTDDEPGDRRGRGGLGPFEDGGWIWFDITTDTDVDAAQRRLVRDRARSGPGQRRGRHPDVQPPGRLRQRAARTHRGPVGGRGDRRGDRARSGRAQGARPPGFPRRGRAAGRSALHPRPAQPRRLRRIQPGDVRGAEKHRLPTDPVHGRRHPHRAGLDPAGAGDAPLRQDADAGGRPDAQPAGAVAPAHHGRGRRTGRTSCGPPRRTPNTTTTSPNTR